MKLCIQTGDIVDRLGFEKGYASIKGIGFDAIDWNLDHALKSKDLRNGTYKGTCIFENSLDEVKAHYAEELSYIQSNGLEIYQAHAPFPPYIHGDEASLDYNIGIYKRMIEYMDYVNCSNVIIHGINFLPNKDKSITAKMHKELNFKLYESLIPTLIACKNPVKVCLENLVSSFNMGNGVVGFDNGVCSVPEEAAEWVDELNSKAGKDVFGFCLDTGHANLAGIKPDVFVRALGSRITAFHIHDNDGIGDRHLAPFTGTINWADFCQAVKETGFDGAMDFETFNQHNKGLDFSEEMGLMWLGTVYKIGDMFRKRIKE